MLQIECEEQLKAAKEFAETTGQLEQLEQQLEFLRRRHG